MGSCTPIRSAGSCCVFALVGLQGCAAHPEFRGPQGVRNQHPVQLVAERLAPRSAEPESRVPSTRDLALSEGVARNTALRVYEQLLAARHRLDEEGSFVSLSRNLCRCLVVAGHVHMGTNRDRIADIYNDHVKRLRWDHENRGAILNRMRETLNLTNEPLDLLDRIIHRATALKVGDEHIRERLAKLIEGRDEWRQEVARLRRDL